MSPSAAMVRDGCLAAASDAPQASINRSAWLPIEGARVHRKEVLLRGRNLATGYVSDVYHGWWDEIDQTWVRWPHANMKPTHYMKIVELPSC